jgi:alpha-galactosidase
MPLSIHSEFALGDTVVRYLSPADRPEQVFLLLLPAGRAKDVVTPRETVGGAAERIVPGMRAWHADRLVHLHVRGDVLPRAFSAGRSLRDSASAEALRFVRQDCETLAGRTVIRTWLADQRGLECVHVLSHVAGEPGLRARTEVRNAGGTPVTLELLTSFSLGTPPGF